jgi:Rrf2 family protein
MISTTAEYALRAAVFLAGKQPEFTGRREIADATMVPHDYLLKVLNGLDAAGIIESRRGPGGGYRLAKNPGKIPVLDVVLAVDEIPRIKKCPLGIAGHIELCPLHKLLDEASRRVEEAFQQTTIMDLTKTRRPNSSCSFPLQ